MAKQTTERKELYAKVSPPWHPIPINIEPFEVNDETPDEVEIRGWYEGCEMDTLAVSQTFILNT